jgi:alkanesulfonate monooxygenase SsuD/methylene tetrahydromethanopterin reductase-like flavin-dependent oxidoreductase (luciferase family)
VPLPPSQGTGLGKPLKLVDHPVRDSIPITIAAIGPQNVALAAELANGWQPPFYIPEKAADVWGAPLREGGARRDPALGTLDVHAGVALAASGVTTLTVRPMAPDHAGRLRLVERLRALADEL